MGEHKAETSFFSLKNELGTAKETELFSLPKALWLVVLALFFIRANVKNKIFEMQVLQIKKYQVL